MRCNTHYMVLHGVLTDWQPLRWSQRSRVTLSRAVQRIQHGN